VYGYHGDSKPERHRETHQLEKCACNLKGGFTDPFRKLRVQVLSRLLNGSKRWTAAYYGGAERPPMLCCAIQRWFGSAKLLRVASAPRFPNVKIAPAFSPQAKTLSPLINPQPQLVSLLLERSLHSFAGRDHVIQERTAAFKPHGRCYFGFW
jgi:hypothetical protein